MLEKILEQDDAQKDVNLNNVPVPENPFLEILGALKAEFYDILIYLFLLYLIFIFSGVCYVPARENELKNERATYVVHSEWLLVHSDIIFE